MIKFRFAAVAALPVAAALVVLAACGGSTSTSSNGQGVPLAAKSQAVTIHYKLVASDDADAKTGPDGNKHDTFWTDDSTNVAVGDKITIVVDNFDDMPHGMVFPDLGITEMVVGGKDGQPGVTTFSFTATKTGTFRWYCQIPCDTDQDQWAMKDGSSGPSIDDFMAGYITISA